MDASELPEGDDAEAMEVDQKKFERAEENEDKLYQWCERESSTQRPRLAIVCMDRSRPLNITRTYWWLSCSVLQVLRPVT